MSRLAVFPTRMAITTFRAKRVAAQKGNVLHCALPCSPSRLPRHQLLLLIMYESVLEDTCAPNLIAVVEVGFVALRLSDRHTSPVILN